MKKIIILAAALCILVFASTEATAQKPTEIKFARGTHQSIVTGKLTGYKASRTYTIRVGQSQTITTENAGKKSITISIEAPAGSTYEQDMAADCHDKNEVTPTVAGTYKITVTQCTKAELWKGTFKFKVVAQ